MEKALKDSCCYDAMGNRIAKHVINDDDKQSTFYALDAQGNVMNVYTYNNEINENLYLSERNIYGSSRLGQEQTHIKMDKTSNGNYLMFENPASGGVCVTPGYINFESSGTTHSYLDYDNDGDLDVQATNPSSAWSVQVTLAVIPGQTFTVNYDVLQISGGQLEPNPRRCDTGASAPGSYAVTTPGSYSMSVAVPANGPSMYRFKWYSYAGVSYTLGNISVTGADFNAFGTAGSNPSSEGLYANEFGDKRYELSNHLGNVLEVVTDRKIPIEGTGGSAGTVEFYTADVVSYSDYFPFGMQMPNRNGSSGDYRYGFQGQEKDNEIKNIEGSSVNYKYRMHDPRVGRFFARDPIGFKYPHNSPYAFSENMVIHAVELEGLEADPLTTTTTLTVVEGGGGSAGAAGGSAVAGPAILVLANIYIWARVYENIMSYSDLEQSEIQAKKSKDRLQESQEKYFETLRKFGPSSGLTKQEIDELINLEGRSLDLSQKEKSKLFNLQQKLREGVAARGSEINLDAKDVNEGRNMALDLTGLEAGKDKMYIGRLGKGKGKKVGLQGHDDVGNYVRYRYDLDEHGDFHINVEKWMDGESTKYRIDIPGGKAAYDKKIEELNK